MIAIHQSSFLKSLSKLSFCLRSKETKFSQRAILKNYLSQTQKFGFSEESNPSENPKDDNSHPKDEKLQKVRDSLQKNIKAEIDYEKLNIDRHSQSFRELTQKINDSGFKINPRPLSVIVQFVRMTQYERRDHGKQNQDSEQQPSSLNRAAQLKQKLNKRELTDVRIVFQAKYSNKQPDEPITHPPNGLLQKISMQLAQQIKKQQEPPQYQRLWVFIRNENSIREFVKETSAADPTGRCNSLDFENSWLMLDVFVAKRDVYCHRLTLIDSYEDVVNKKYNPSKSNFQYDGIELKAWSQELRDCFENLLRNEGVSDQLLSKIVQYGYFQENHLYLKWLQDVQSLCK